MKQDHHHGLLVDYNAVGWAAFLTGFIFLAVLYIGTKTFGLRPYLVLQYLASTVLGEAAINPHAPLNAKVIGFGLLSYFVIAFVFTFVLAVICHRWGLWVGMLTGALLGLATYFINFYGLSYFSPWFFLLTGKVTLLWHIAFGFVAGALYESFESDEIEALQGEI